jgi:hypothetical protein
MHSGIRTTPSSAAAWREDLKLGNQLADERSKWQISGRPYTTAGGKNAHVRVQRVEQPGVTEVRMWGAYEKSQREASD